MDFTGLAADDAAAHEEDVDDEDEGLRCQYPELVRPLLGDASSVKYFLVVPLLKAAGCLLLILSNSESRSTLCLDASACDSLVTLLLP